MMGGPLQRIKEQRMGPRAHGLSQLPGHRFGWGTSQLPLEKFEYLEMLVKVIVTAGKECRRQMSDHQDHPQKVLVHDKRCWKSSHQSIHSRGETEAREPGLELSNPLQCITSSPIHYLRSMALARLQLTTD